MFCMYAPNTAGGNLTARSAPHNRNLRASRLNLAGLPPATLRCDESTAMNRRHFLGLAGGAAGYSVVVRAGA
jgi:hypothetical protein